MGDEDGEDVSKWKVFVGEAGLSTLSEDNWLCQLLRI